MARIPLPEASTATGETQAILADAGKRWGFVPNIVRALSLRPEILKAEDEWTKAVMWKGTLPRVLKEHVATTVSATNECAYCATMHGQKADENGAPEGTTDACRRLDFSGFNDAEKAALGFASKAAADMKSITQGDVDDLLEHYSAEQVVELCMVIASFMLYNTFVTTLGLRMDEALLRTK